VSRVFCFLMIKTGELIRKMYADLKPPLIDLEDRNGSTGRKQACVMLGSVRD